MSIEVNLFTSFSSLVPFTVEFIITRTRELMKLSGTETTYVSASTGSFLRENSGSNVAKTKPVKRRIKITALAANPQMFEIN